ncbi:PREDICTED: putative fatty acyl-CoA reductase CG5065 [Wasmannia auropunctata]|uniref:putative fatty acyl-CoA reductase CG5065 n=1 Tax=Wasmannia auropunctata TaxID=64793 RepID=UPI0005EE2E8B|nr:PREDICTED: putative fatty acyl-CoA reductase CG5065 [Wasmannia auropunctata]
MEEKVTKIASQWPNTYTFTKAIAEALLREEGRGLPIGIFRPAIIISSANEPLVGWVDNIYGPMGFLTPVALGLQRFLLGNGNLKTNMVPVDFTANALIASAWDVFNQWKKEETMLIYNFVSIDAPTWNEYINKMISLNKLYPVKEIIWMPLLKIIRQKVLYKICIWIGHLLPAFLMDAVNICMNRRPRMWKLYRKIHKYSDAIAPFLLKHLDYSHHNILTMWNRLSEKDHQLFKFQMKEIDWTKYLVNHYKGMRLYILKEDDGTLKINRIRYKRFYLIHHAFKTVFISAILWIIWSILAKIFV